MNCTFRFFIGIYTNGSQTGTIIYGRELVCSVSYFHYIQLNPFPGNFFTISDIVWLFTLFHNSFDLMLFQHTPHRHGWELYSLPKQIVGNPLRSPSSCLTHRLRIMVSISGVIFILASLDGRLDLSDNSDLPCSFSQFIQRYNVERVIPHRKAVFVTEPVSTYSSSHFWRIRISSFMLRRYGLRFANEKKKCSVSIDTWQLNTTPLFSHLLNTSLSIYTLLRSHSWLIWSKQPLMSPSSIHCGKQSLLNHLWSASIASAVLLNFLNPYEFASASLSVISSKAIRYILHGSVLHGWYSQRSCLAICFGYVDLPQREGLISSPFQ